MLSVVITMIMSRNYFFYNLLISFKYFLLSHLPTSILYTPNNKFFLKSLLQQAGYKCCYSVLFILRILLESIFSYPRTALSTHV